jgi:hypothetical protein
VKLERREAQVCGFPPSRQKSEMQILRLAQDDSKDGARSFCETVESQFIALYPMRDGKVKNKDDARFPRAGG